MAKETSSNQMAVGIGWFDRDQWEQLTRVVEDRSTLDDTFEDWERSATKACREIMARGLRVEKVPVVVDDLVAWCQAEKLPIDGPSRAKYVTRLLRERHK